MIINITGERDNRKIAHGAGIYAGTLIFDFTAHNSKTQIKPSGQELS